MKERKGISLIVLIVTIIVMIIIAGAIIISLTQTNIIDRGEQAVESHNQKGIEEAINLEYQNLLLLGLGKVNVEDLTQKIEELSNTYKEIQNVTAGNEKVVYTLSLTGKEYQISTKTGKIEEYVEAVKVPFTNYIEDGPYYYVYKYDGADRKIVITISRETSKFNVYTVEGQKATYEESYNFELIDKLDAITRFGITPETTEQALGITFDELSDYALYYDANAGGEVYAANVFRDNYTQMIFANNWYTLDTSFELSME